MKTKTPGAPESEKIEAVNRKSAREPAYEPPLIRTDSIGTGRLMTIVVCDGSSSSSGRKNTGGRGKGHSRAPGCSNVQT